MLSEELQNALAAAFVTARMEGHDLLTVEHLLLALLSAANVSEALSAAGTDMEKLEKDLRDYIRDSIQSVKDGERREVQPTLSFQRVLQRAIYHVQASGKKQVSTLNVLVAMFAEKDTHAVYLLGEQGVTRLDIVNFISHGIAKNGSAPEPAQDNEDKEEGGNGREAQ